MAEKGFTNWWRVDDLAQLDSDSLQDNIVYWCEVRADCAEHRSKFQSLVRTQRQRGRFPRICILTRTNDAGSASILRKSNSSDFEVRVWSDFVTPGDSQSIVDRIGRQNQWSKGYCDLLSSIVSQIVRNDISRAAVYAKRSIQDILADHQILHEHIWIGQIRSLFPQIDAERRRLIRQYSEQWNIPYRSATRKVTVKNIEDLEVADLHEQCKDSPTLVKPADYKEISFLRFARNKLAHMEILDWKDLSTDVAIRAFGVRVPDLL